MYYDANTFVLKTVMLDIFYGVFQQDKILYLIWVPFHLLFYVCC